MQHIYRCISQLPLWVTKTDTAYCIIYLVPIECIYSCIYEAFWRDVTLDSVCFLGASSISRETENKHIS